MKLRIKSLTWNIRKKETTNQNNKKKNEPPQKEDNVSVLQDNFKRSNIHIIGVPEGEEESKKLEIYLKK